jgi:predicted Zn-dependent protease
MKITIENYENMTPEEKLAAWEAFDPEKNGFVSKSTFDKKASEASELGKQLKARMTDDEAKAAKDAEERAELLARLEQLENEKAVNSHVTSYLAMGYDEKLARSSAEALVKGDMDTVFANQKTHIESREKALKAEWLKETPPPAGGGVDKGMKKEDLSKLSLAEQAKFANENPDIYKGFYGGN